MARIPDPHLRARLIDAATEVFAMHGYAGATLDGIAARAGVTKGGVYFHFDGKEELFFAVLDHWRERRRRALVMPAPAGLGAAAALRAFLAGYLAFHLREPAATQLARVLATELRGRFTARLREDDRQELRWLRASLRELLVLGARDGSLRVEDPVLTAFVLTAGVRGVLEQWITAPADVEMHCDEDQLARALVEPFATGSFERSGGDDGSGFDLPQARDGS
ncbi:MAG: TetR/AcrR family transcriptional regulator [Planctomycetes bacterium]|nr:TetR/AcrR family transcriptional regulator [Planctomycetota bacterium]